MKDSQQIATPAAAVGGSVAVSGDDVDMSKYTIHVVTVQSTTIRTLIEALKDVLTDTVIVCDKAGLRLKAVDPQKIALVDLTLHADRFNKYHCPVQQRICVNMVNLFRMIKSTQQDDTLSFYIEAENPNDFHIQVVNADTGKSSDSVLNLLDLQTDGEFSIPQTEIPCIITMPSVDFQKNCRDLQSIGPDLDIRCVRDEITFGVRGDIGSKTHKVVPKPNNKVHLIKACMDDDISGRFRLKFLIMFTKCTNLSDHVKIYLRPDFPLILEYDVAGMGSIKMCLTPSADV